MTQKEAQVPPFHHLLLPPFVLRGLHGQQMLSCHVLLFYKNRVEPWNKRPSSTTSQGWMGSSGPTGLPTRQPWGQSAPQRKTDSRPGGGLSMLCSIPTSAGPHADTSPPQGPPRQPRAALVEKILDSQPFGARTLNFHLPYP